MPKTPAQARYNRLKQIHEQAGNERKANELERQQQLLNDNTDRLPPEGEISIQTDKSDYDVA